MPSILINESVSKKGVRHMVKKKVRLVIGVATIAAVGLLTV